MRFELLMLALLLATLLSCKRDGRGAPSPSSSAAARSAAVKAATAPPKPRASAGAKLALTPAEEEAERRYREALARGRRLTVKRDYAAAEAAFDEALKVHDMDSRALGERGYARLQAGDLDGAEADFRLADGRTSDRQLAAQIFFNQGLVAERRGDLETARVAFARSQQSNATRAAAKKLKELNATGCTVAWLPLKEELRHYDSWQGLWQQLHPGQRIENDMAAKKDFEVEDCDPACSVQVDGGGHVVVPGVQGLDVLRNADRGYFYRCGAPPQFEFERKGSILHVTSTNTELVTSLCGPCDENYCPSCCADGPSHRYDTFIHLTAKRAVLRVSQYGPSSETFTAIPVSFDQTQVAVVGGSCNRRYPLSAQ